MKTNQIKPSVAVVYDTKTVEHAMLGAQADRLLLADANRLGGLANKAWRASFMLGRVAGRMAKSLADLETNAKAFTDRAITLLGKAAPGSKGKPQRTKAEQTVYDNAKMELSRFCRAHNITPANKARGKAKAKAKAPATTETKVDATPKAITAKHAEAYVRMQAAVLKAYAEKNKALLSNAFLHAIGEFAEAIEHVPTAE